MLPPSLNVLIAEASAAAAAAAAAAGAAAEAADAPFRSLAGGKGDSLGLALPLNTPEPGNKLLNSGNGELFELGVHVWGWYVGWGQTGPRSLHVGRQLGPLGNLVYSGDLEGLTRLLRDPRSATGQGISASSVIHFMVTFWPGSGDQNGRLAGQDVDRLKGE